MEEEGEDAGMCERDNTRSDIHGDNTRPRLPHLIWTHQEREFFIDNLLVQILFIIVMIRWTGLVPWEFESPFPGSLTSTFLGRINTMRL